MEAEGDVELLASLDAQFEHCLLLANERSETWRNFNRQLWPLEGLTYEPL